MLHTGTPKTLIEEDGRLFCRNDPCLDASQRVERHITGATGHQTHVVPQAGSRQTGKTCSAPQADALIRL